MLDRRQRCSVPRLTDEHQARARASGLNRGNVVRHACRVQLVFEAFDCHARVLRCVNPGEHPRGLVQGDDLEVEEGDDDDHAGEDRHKELNQADALFVRERSRQAMVKVRAQHVPEVDALVMLIVWSVAAEKFVFCRLDTVTLWLL